MAVTDGVRIWLQSHRNLRELRAPRSTVAAAATGAMSQRVAETDAELTGQVVRRSTPSGEPVTGDATWLPPLWLSW